MKKFLISSGIFLLSNFLLLCILEYCVRSYNTLFKQKQRYLTEKCDSIEVLILGNSHAADGINPEAFELNTFNAAMGSQSQYFDIEITKKYLEKMVRLKYVLISVDYHSLYFTHEPMRDFLYFHYYGINYKNQLSFNSRFSLLYGYGIKEGIALLKSNPTITRKGWAGWPSTNYDSLSEITGRAKIKYFNKLINSNKNYKNEMMTNLDSFIKLLKFYKVNPVLITLPCHKIFNNKLNSQIMEQNKLDLEKIINMNGIKYLNYQFEPLPDSCFYNVDHLNKYGASNISKKVNDQLMLIEDNSNHNKFKSN